MYHGIINVRKEAGYTSHDVVAKLRGICKQKKIGHTGTLDPDAVGVLPVCLGNATRVCDLLTDRSKEYVAGLLLGVISDTQDVSGKILESREVTVDPAMVEETAASFVGDIMQLPPMYSALKVNGKKLYELARAGREVERTPRPVTVYSLRILEENHPRYTMQISCSKGTYIRTLCHDIGGRLGCGGVMESLVRTRVGEFTLENAHTLEEIQSISEAGRLREWILPVESVFSEMRSLAVAEKGFKSLQNGNQLTLLQLKNTDKEFTPEDGEQFRIYSHQNVFFGIYRYEAAKGLLCPVKLFLTE